MPTAVMMESSENTMSMMMICTMMAPKLRLHALRRMTFLTLGELVDLHGGLPHQEQAARDEDEIAPGNLRRRGS